VTATKLLVLGVVREFGEAHGYQVRRELSLWGTEHWANVKPGSIYHALRQSAKSGLLEELGTEASDHGPERTRYALTEDGETEFLRLLRTALSDAEAKREMWMAGVNFLTALPRREAVNLLRLRVHNLDACRSAMSGLQEHQMSLGKPAHVAELFQWWITEYATAAEFTRGLVERLEDGAYILADDAADAFGAPGRRSTPDAR
jgi:DNA-binding PadR family transcriptional regulator